MTDRTTDHVRVLSDLSGHVVDALLDDPDDASHRDAFSDALHTYRSEGAPELAAPWRLPTFLGGARVAAVLRRLTRDLLHDASAPPTETAPAEAAVETPPPNVRRIGDVRDVPALELASDGTWRPSGSALASKEDVDAALLRRTVPAARSRYPQVAREGIDLPPAPASARLPRITEPPGHTTG